MEPLFKEGVSIMSRALTNAPGAKFLLGWCVRAFLVAIATTFVGCQANPNFRSVAASSNRYDLAKDASKGQGRVIPVAYLGGPISTTEADCATWESPANVTTLDLAAALQIAGVDNPTTNLARERVREALANQLAANSLLLPSVNVGGNFRLHRGALQDDPGFFRFPASQSLLVGAGAGAIGAGNVAIPGVWLFANLSDAAYAPVIARQQTTARQFDSEAVHNSVFLEVCAAYLNLVSAEVRFQLLQKANSEITEIARITGEFAKAKEGAPADANRAAANAELIRRQLREVEGENSSASARLARFLNLDPIVRIRTPAGKIEPIRIINEDADTETLLQTAMNFRPELVARSAAMQVAETQVRQERVRPWLPLLTTGFSAGTFGGGSNQVATEFGNFSGRTDLSVVAVWNFQNLGVGNRARVFQARAVVGEAFAAYEIALNQVRCEVVEAQAAAKNAARQIKAARIALADAEEGYNLESERIKRGQGRPIEAIDSFRQLNDARLELLRAIIAFDLAQFQLLVALGNNPSPAVAGCSPTIH